MKPKKTEDGQAFRRREVYLRLGAEDGVDHVASTLYARLVLDPNFGQVFTDAHVNTSHLLWQERDLIATSLGGPSQYNNLEEARDAFALTCEGFDISTESLKAMIGHLREILRELDLPEESIEQVIAVAQYITKTGEGAYAQGS